MNIDGVLRPLSEAALVVLEASPPCPVRPITDRLLKSVGISSLEWRRWLGHSAADHALRWQRLKACWSDYLTTYLRSHPQLGPYRVAKVLGCGASTVRHARARMSGKRRKRDGTRVGAGLRPLTEAEEEAILWLDNYLSRIERSPTVELPMTGWRRFRMKVGARRASNFCTNYCPDLLKRYNDATDKYWQAAMHYRMRHSQAETAAHFDTCHENIRRRWTALQEGAVVNQLILVDGVLQLVTAPTHRRTLRSDVHV